MPRQPNRSFQLKHWTVDPSCNEITCDSESHVVSPRAMDVLTLLAAQPEKTLTTDEIIQGTDSPAYVSENAVHKAVSELRQVFGDNARDPEYIATVRKRGYRLVVPVHVFADEPPEKTPRRNRGRPLTYAVLIALLLAMAALIWLQEEELTYPVGQPLNPTVAVLPFENAEDSGEHHGLAIGLTNAIMRSLFQAGVQIPSPGRLRELRALGMSPTGIGAELSVPYVLSGQFRVVDEQVRVTVQLHDAQKHQQFWIEQFDRPVTDLFALEDDISRQVAASLAERISLPNQLTAAGRGTESVQAYLAYLRAGQHTTNCEGLALAQRDYELAVTHDPEFANARLLGGRTMAVRAILCGQSSIAEAMEFGGSELRGTRANPFIRAVVNSARAASSSRKTRFLEEAYARPVEEYRRWAMNGLERPQLIDYEFAGLLVGAGLYEPGIAYLERGRRMEFVRDGGFSVDSYSLLPEALFYAARYADCIKLSNEAIRIAERESMQLSGQHRMVRALCASSAQRPDVIERDIEESNRRLESVGTDPDSPELTPLRNHIDMLNLELAIANRGLDAARIGQDPLRFENHRDMYRSYYLYRLASADAVLTELNRLASTDQGRSANRVVLRGTMEQFRPELARDPRYLDLLDHYDVADDWQSELCVRAGRLQQRTGIELDCSTGT